MDSTHLHLMLNHFPIIGTLLGTALMVYAYLSQSEANKKAALWMWFAMSLIAIPVFLTGEPAEESVEGLAGVSEALIEQHEEAAELAIWVMEALGLFSLLTILLGFKKPELGKTMTGIAFALSLVTFLLMARTGYLGGQIRHSEIRSGVSVQAPVEQGGEKDDD